MKKRNLIIVVLSFMSLNLLDAQTQTFKKGDGVLNLTLGLLNARYATGASSSVPPIAASYEVGVVDNVAEKGTIGIGGYVGYTSAKWDYPLLDWSWKSTDIIIGMRGVFHYPFVEKLDTYAGLMLAYDINSWSETGTATFRTTHTSYGGLILPGFIGARYYFNDKFAGLLELGWGIAYFNIGVAVKLQ